MLPDVQNPVRSQIDGSQILIFAIDWVFQFVAATNHFEFDETSDN
jgi:hypothetical protein